MRLEQGPRGQWHETGGRNGIAEPAVVEASMQFDHEAFDAMSRARHDLRQNPSLSSFDIEFKQFAGIEPGSIQNMLQRHGIDTSTADVGNVARPAWAAIIKRDAAVVIPNCGVE